MIPCKYLDLEDYRSLIKLDEQFKITSQIQTENYDALVEDLVDFLVKEKKNRDIKGILTLYPEKRRLLKALLTIRNPEPLLPIWFQEKFDQLIKFEALKMNITDVDNLSKCKDVFPDSPFKSCNNLILWQGDITTLRVDAIVNAANIRLLGCFRPFHACIDNAIHSISGPRLREDCHKIMQKQGCEEANGLAKVTRGYNLPSNFILHTVGPIFDKQHEGVSQKQEKELSNCYISCLNLAQKIPKIRSIAFCSISTGAFGFPFVPATKIALNSVDNWLENNLNAFESIVFNVFSMRDFLIYESLLKGENTNHG